MSATTASRILDYVKDQSPTFVSLTKALVEAESPSARPESHDEVRRVLRLALAGVGYDSRESGVPNKPRHIFAVPANRPKRSRSQLLLGHDDTVWPVGTLNDRPFAIDGNVIHGPGTFDMKAGLAQIVLALGAVRDLELKTPVIPIVFVNADEEIGSRTSTRYVRWLAEHADRTLVMEPALGQRGDIKTERKGIGRFTVTVYGKAAHAGLDPESGASAILELSHIIQRLFELNDVEQGITVNVGTVDGGIQPNVIAPHSKAVVDVRVRKSNASFMASNRRRRTSACTSKAASADRRCSRRRVTGNCGRSRSAPVTSLDSSCTRLVRVADRTVIPRVNTRQRWTGSARSGTERMPCTSTS